MRNKGFKNELFLSILSIIWFFISAFPHNPTYNKMFIDSGIYAYIGQQINNGKILYKEVWDYKFPGIYYIYAFLFKIFPDSRWTLYFFDIFTNILMLILIFFILKKFKFEDFFWIVSLLFITTYRIYACFSGGNLTEHLFIFFFIISFYLLIEKPTKIGDFILGNCFVWLSMFKQPYFLIVFVLFLFFRNRIFKGEIKFFISGFLFSFIFFLYIFIKGFPESIDTIIFPFHLTKGTQSKKINDFLGLIGDLNYRTRVILFTGPGKQILMMLIPILFVRDKLKVLFFSLLATIFFIYFFTFALYAHYILLLNIPLIVGSIILIRNYSKKLIILFLLICLLSPFNLMKKRVFHFKRAFYKFVILKDKRINVHPLVITIAKYVKKGETLFIPEFIGEVYFITKTESPWRFAGFTQGLEKLPKYKIELIKLIREKPPDYFYLEMPIEEFEKTFELKSNEYKLLHLENNFYRFIIFKYNSS